MKFKVPLKYLCILVICASFFAAFPRTVETENLEWSRVNIPSNGVSGQWVLAAGSDLHCLTLAADGTLYCSANPAATPYRLFKSTDSGVSWTYTGRVEDSIVDIAVLPDDPDCVYYATTVKVFKSADAGENFELLAANPGGSGTGNKEITSLDAASADGLNYLAVSVRDTDAAQYGGVYALDESQPGSWLDCGIGNYDVYKVAFSPNFADDRQLIAIGTNEQDTLISSGTIEGGWGAGAGEARLAGLTFISAEIAFPSDYDSTVVSGKYTQFICLNTGQGQGGVYCLRGQADPVPSTLTKLHSGDFSSAAAAGNAANAQLLAGSASSTQIYFSEDAGAAWSPALKPPTGTTGTEVLMAADFADSGLAFAVTSGAESAFSVSRDKGGTWNQTGLIDTRISTILDLAISLDFAQGPRLFLLTADIQNSVWVSFEGGSEWQRIYCTAASQPERIDLIMLSPRYVENSVVLFAGMSGGNPVIWKSEDNGQSFIRQASVDPETGAPVDIGAWAMTSDNVLFVGSFDGDHGLVYQTGPDSLSYIEKGAAGSQIIVSLSLSPDYNNDHTILAGTKFGRVFFSDDSGLVFESLPFDVAEPPFVGNISPAFDAEFAQNQTVYAADDTAGKGIYRFVIGESFAWEPIDSSLPDEARIGQIVVSGDGALYALNLQPVDNAGSQGGMERTLDSAAATPVFQTVIGGLEDGVTLKKLWLQGNNLWTIDTHNKKLLIYTDTLVAPVSLISPADGAAGVSPDSITLSWEPVDGAEAYHWQIDTAADFSGIADQYEGETAAFQIMMTDLDKNTAYYWRVRAVQPVGSPWSAVRSFDTDQIDAPALSQPGSGSTASVAPMFRWSVCEGAVQYELKVALDDQFSSLAINRLCSANVWQSNIALQYDTSYYWKVRAIGERIASTWSAVGLFTTGAEPTPVPAPAPIPGLSSPRPSSPVSSTSAAIEPVFRWSSVAGADQYELAVAKNDRFSPLVIDEICNANTWACDITLEYGTAYYWKVRALQGGSPSDWSGAAAFTTRAGTSPTPTPTPSPTPSPAVASPSTQDPTAASPSLPAASTTPAGSLAALEYSPMPTTKAGMSASASSPTELPLLSPASPSPTPESPANSNNPTLYIVVGGLAVLATVSTATTIFMLKKFK